MNRLQAELQRLYASSAAGTRAMVLEVAGPGAWDALANAWHAVQAELQWPAPAIAVSGVDSYQLWFSLAEPVPPAQARVVLEALRARHLAGVAPARVRMKTCERLDPGAGTELPPLQQAPDRWSAFVAPDLAAMFADEPWLDLPPSADAQADVLARLQSIRPAEWQRALLQPAPGSEAGAAAVQAPDAPQGDPQRFLLAVMNDPALEMGLRIEAAKALLPYFVTRGA